MDTYRAATEHCVLVDRSELGKLALTGPQAKELLGGQVTNDVEGLTAGTGLYAAFLTPKGKMLGDLRILDVGPPTDELLLLCERPALQALFDLLRRGAIGWQAELHKRTVQMALFSLIGPDSARIAGVPDLPQTEHATVGSDPIVARTDLGVDVLCAAERADEVKAQLVAAGAVEADEQLAEVLRVESGRPRFGIDLQPDAVIPQEAGLNDRAVSFTKGCYVGQETVARLHYRGKPNRHLRGLRAAEPLVPGTVLQLGGREVGTISTAVVSPAHGHLALALVRREAEPGTQLDAGGTAAEVVALPFA